MNEKTSSEVGEVQPMNTEEVMAAMANLLQRQQITEKALMCQEDTTNKMFSEMMEVFGGFMEKMLHIMDMLLEKMDRVLDLLEDREDPEDH